jgi:hypothetical protein
LLENVVVKGFDEISLVPGSVSGIWVDKEVSGILEVNDEVFLSSGLRPPQQVVDLILFSDVVCLRVRVLYMSVSYIYPD